MKKTNDAQGVIENSVAEVEQPISDAQRNRSAEISEQATKTLAKLRQSAWYVPKTDDEEWDLADAYTRGEIVRRSKHLGVRGVGNYEYRLPFEDE